MEGENFSEKINRLLPVCRKSASFLSAMSDTSSVTCPDGLQSLFKLFDKDNSSQ